MSFLEDYGIRVRTGKMLDAEVRRASSLLRRDCFAKLKHYLSKPAGKVMLLNGLRRTGKTFLARQGIAMLPESEQKKAVFVRFPRISTGVPKNPTLLFFDELFDKGYRYFFVDECTSILEFPSWAKEMADAYAESGCHVILLGTDSLAMSLAKKDELDGRFNEISTTRIPFHEWKRLLEYSGKEKLSVRDYIYYGGILDFDGIPIETALVPETAYSFRDPESIAHYLNSAIALNLLNTIARNVSLKFASLHPLWQDGRLVESVMRVVHDQNHLLTGADLAERFKHDDFYEAYKNLKKAGEAKLIIRRKKEEILRRIEDGLCLSHGPVKLDRNEREAVKRYLCEMDVFTDAEVRIMPSPCPERRTGDRPYLKESRLLQTQPGIRAGQMKHACGIIWDNICGIAPFDEAHFLDIATSVVEGRLLEDIVFADLQSILPEKCEIFKLVWGVESDEAGEFDVAILDKRDIRDPKISLFEVKRRAKIHGDEAKHLKNPRLIAHVAETFGRIASRTVVYNGPQERRTVLYVNADKFLSSLGNNPEAALFPQLADKWKPECPLEPWMATNEPANSEYWENASKTPFTME